MPNSPKCLNCFLEKRGGQCYKVVGEVLYKCGTCKHSYAAGEFDLMAFKWMEEPAEWAGYIHKEIEKKQVMEEKAVEYRQVVKAELARIEAMSKPIPVDVERKPIEEVVNTVEDVHADTGVVDEP